MSILFNSKSTLICLLIIVGLVLSSSAAPSSKEVKEVKEIKEVKAAPVAEKAADLSEPVKSEEGVNKNEPLDTLVKEPEVIKSDVEEKKNDLKADEKEKVVDAEDKDSEEKVDKKDTYFYDDIVPEQKEDKSPEKDVESGSESDSSSESDESLAAGFAPKSNDDDDSIEEMGDEDDTPSEGAKVVNKAQKQSKQDQREFNYLFIAGPAFVLFVAMLAGLLKFHPRKNDPMTAKKNDQPITTRTAGGIYTLAKQNAEETEPMEMVTM